MHGNWLYFSSSPLAARCSCQRTSVSGITRVTHLLLLRSIMTGMSSKTLKMLLLYSACVTLPLVSINMFLKISRVVSIIPAVPTLKLPCSLCTAVPPRLGPCNDIGSNGPGRALMKRGRSRIVRPAIISGDQPQQGASRIFLLYSSVLVN